MEKYQFTSLSWLNLPDHEAKVAARWYQGPGWYYNPVDAAGKKRDVRCVAKSEPANHHAGMLEALNTCGTEGWSVAAFVPASSEGLLGKAVHAIAGLSPDTPSFILQRRSAP
jgi:hypothetical protein